LINGSFNFSSNTFYLAVYTNAATLDETTTAYTTTGEASGGNYVAGGQIVTASVNTETTSSGSVTYINFSSPVWTGVITARGALIYKAGDNGAVCVLDFGSNKTSTTTFPVTMPANTSTSALIRLV
jgi:hypothetical protein